MTSLTWEQVTGWRIARGHLGRRVAAAKLVDVVGRICGAHAQIMTTVPLALGARLNRITAATIDDAIEQRTLVKTWAMRGTLHVFAAGDLPLYCAAQATRDQYQNPSFLRYFGLEEADVHAVLDAVPQALDGETLSREELGREICASRNDPTSRKGCCRDGASCSSRRRSGGSCASARAPAATSRSCVPTSGSGDGRSTAPTRL